MQKDTEKLKINLEENLPEPSEWDIKEFSKPFNKEKNDVKTIDFMMIIERLLTMLQNLIYQKLENLKKESKKSH